MPAETISSLVSALPEVYQPIFGHPELSDQVSRPCRDRLESIVQVYSSLQQQLSRPLKVLDLGCAQGFFSLSLAERGATVHGIDYLHKNVDVCDALARENPHLKVTFENCRIETAIMRSEPEQYDLVLGLSVFHHVVHESGTHVVKALLKYAADVSGALIVELALRDEPLYWGAAQARDPSALLERIAFVQEVARHSTHLSSITRPLYVASNRYWILGGLAGRFDSWTVQPHALGEGSHEGRRRYFFCTNTVAKTYRFSHDPMDRNRIEFVREKAFLTNPPPGFSIPACLLAGESSTEGWIVTERLRGRLLLDLLHEGAVLDHRRILLSVLEQLAALEVAGLYHDDIRTWNIFVTDDGSGLLIDFGSISAQVHDVVPPGNPFLSFLIVVRETTTGAVEDIAFSRIVAISPHGLPQPYHSWAMALWQRPLHEWTFKFMHETLLKTHSVISEPTSPQPVEPWMSEIKCAVQARELRIMELESRTTQAELTALQAQSRADQAEAEVLATQQSYSWWITRPLRWLARHLRLKG